MKTATTILETLIIFDEGGIVANTFHLSLDVPDLDSAVAFYAELFDQEPAKRKPGYAKFELANPPVALALQQADRPALSHLGIRVDDSAEVEGASTRLKASGLVTLDERDTSCCYARQDKVWVADPAGNRWEVYTLLEDIDEDVEHEHEAAPACCTPVAGEASACCT
jgi:catechol 2,3-dioxygenase-like lactoylglutathione lyase family enzyme